MFHLTFEQNEKSYLTLKSDSSYFSLFDGVISDVAKTLPNAVLIVQKSSIYAGFRRFCDYSYSTQLN